MQDGFYRAAAASVNVKVADPVYNAGEIWKMIRYAQMRKASLLVLPELVLTGYTCGDLFWHKLLLEKAQQQLDVLLQASAAVDMIVVLGMPLVVRQKLYNCAVFMQKGKILGIVPKKNLPGYGEYYETRHFTPGPEETQLIQVAGQEVPFGMNLLFCSEEDPDLVIAAELCEDLWVPVPPSGMHAMAGATIICNPSASDELTAKAEYRKELVISQSARTLGAYLYANAGEGESTQDVVYSGHCLIAENGTLLGETERFMNGYIEADLDLHRLSHDRQKMTTFQCREMKDTYTRVYFSQTREELEVHRFIHKTPFIPKKREDREVRCQEILMIQAMGLKKRLEHTQSRCAVIGLSGGLDSTLAALVTARAFDLLGWSREDILCVTMPCFGTTDRTYSNACRLAEYLGASLMEVPIAKAVEQHFSDIGQDPQVHDVTYENSQARERTQVLMDLANKKNGLVIGTGDLSELALGWATYNGDHMSMYAVNCSVPKTLVRYIVQYYAECMCLRIGEEAQLKEVLEDILDTPVSPELLPPENGVISQRTEDLVGPYELHDFFLYYMLRYGFSPRKLLRMARLAFAHEYSDEIIYKWLRTFIRRFFAQQFKRSALPDGPKVGSIALSPRGDLRMPSDACAAAWMAQLDELQMMMIGGER